MARPLEVIGPRNARAPYTYVLTELGTVELQSVFAHFDGTGASGAFRPTLTVRAQDGSIIARVFPDSTLAAGDEADVTFAPFLGAVAGGSGPGTPAFQTLQEASLSGTQPLALGVLPWVVPYDCTIDNVAVALRVGPVGSGFTARVRLNGSSIGTVTIAAGSTSASFTPSTTVLVPGDLLFADVIAVGSSTAGSDFVLQYNGQWTS